MDNLQAAFAVLMAVFGIIMAFAFIADLVNHIKYKTTQLKVLALGLSVSAFCLWSAWALW